MSIDQSDIELALRLADAADGITGARFRANDLRIERKPDRTPVTDADLAVEDRIRELLPRTGRTTRSPARSVVVRSAPGGRG